MRRASLCQTALIAAVAFLGMNSISREASAQNVLPPKPYIRTHFGPTIPVVATPVDMPPLVVVPCGLPWTCWPPVARPVTIYRAGPRLTGFYYPPFH